MKKHLLKTLLICLGFTLICVLYSFKTPDGMKSQQICQTAEISNDTIITSDEKESECIKEVVVESDQCRCSCSLYVSYNDITDYWTLYLDQYCNTVVHVEYSFIIKYADHSQKLFRCKKDLVRNGATCVQEKNIIAEPAEIECIPVSVKAWACFE